MCPHTLSAPCKHNVLGRGTEDRALYVRLYTLYIYISILRIYSVHKCTPIPIYIHVYTNLFVFGCECYNLWFQLFALSSSPLGSVHIFCRLTLCTHVQKMAFFLKNSSLNTFKYHNSFHNRVYYSVCSVCEHWRGPPFINFVVASGFR